MLALDSTEADVMAEYSRGSQDFSTSYQARFIVRGNTSNSISWMASNALRPCRFQFYFKDNKVLSLYRKVTFNHVKQSANSMEDA